jgi:precorrin-2/cobalt-factor-2 C20-methyltransferase
MTENKGIFYGVGVGPGDPELMTLKAIRTIEKSDVIVYPEARGRSGKVLSMEIAEAAYPEIAKKKIASLYLPMTRDEAELADNRGRAAEEIAGYLTEGLNVVFLTLGDPSVYSTYIYLHRLVREKGFDVKIISGVPSFCAAAAVSGDGLVDAEQPLHIIPASYADSRGALALAGTKVLMKTGKSFGEIVGYLREKEAAGAEVRIVENCGMETERVWRLDEIKEDAAPGYFTIVIVKDSPIKSANDRGSDPL